MKIKFQARFTPDSEFEPSILYPLTIEGRDKYDCQQIACREFTKTEKRWRGRFNDMQIVKIFD